MRSHSLSLLPLAALAFAARAEASDLSSTARALAEPDGAAEHDFGFDADRAGDVDGDGFDDLLIGARAHGEDGAAYVFYGGPGGVSEEASDLLIASDGAEWDWFGTYVNGAGDLDGDGFDDVLVGTTGKAYLYFGSAGGVDAGSEAQLAVTPLDSWYSPIRGAGDVNGDGHGDLILGSPYEDEAAGTVTLYYGGPSGIDESSAEQLASPESEEQTFLFGTHVAAAGDLDGDGLGEVAISRSGYSSLEVLVFRGDASGLAAGSAEGYAVLLPTYASDTGFGTSLAGDQDLNGDGYADLAIGAPTAFYTFLGGEAGVDTDPAQRVAREEPYEGGEGVAAAGDLDDDGYGDLVVSALTAWPRVYFGSPACLDEDTRERLSVPDSTGAPWLGYNGAGGAGDLNGDGASDLFLGLQGDGNTAADLVYTFSGTPAAEASGCGCSATSRAPTPLGGLLLLALSRRRARLNPHAAAPPRPRWRRPPPPRSARSAPATSPAPRPARRRCL